MCIYYYVCYVGKKEGLLQPCYNCCPHPVTKF